MPAEQFMLSAQDMLRQFGRGQFVIIYSSDLKSFASFLWVPKMQ